MAESKNTSTVQKSGKYWFNAKRYGWGWGLPCAWQGWLFLAFYVAYTFISTVWFIGAAELAEQEGQEGFIWQLALYLVLQLVGVLTVFTVGYKKGPRPRMRKGGLHADDHPDTPLGRF